VECIGCADRSAYDLSKHGEETKQRLVAERKLPAPKTIQVTGKYNVFIRINIWFNLGAIFYRIGNG